MRTTHESLCVNQGCVCVLYLLDDSRVQSHDLSEAAMRNSVQCCHDGVPRINGSSVGSSVSHGTRGLESLSQPPASLSEADHPRRPEAKQHHDPALSSSQDSLEKLLLAFVSALVSSDALFVRYSGRFLRGALPAPLDTNTIGKL